MNSWSDVEAATISATDSTGSALEENSKYIDSIQGKINALKSAWSEFSNRTVNENWIKWVYSALTAITNFGTSIGGLLPVVGLLVTALSSKLAPALSKVWVILKDGFKGSLSFKSGLQGVLGSVGLLTTAITFLVALYENWKQGQIDTISSAAKNTEELSAKTKTLYNYMSQYQELAANGDWGNDKREKAAEIQKNIVGLIGNEGQAIDLVNGKLDEQSNKLEEISIKYSQSIQNQLKTQVQMSENSLVTLMNDFEERVIGETSGSLNAVTKSFVDNYISSVSSSLGDYLNTFSGVTGGKYSIDIGGISDVEDIKNVISELTGLSDALYNEGLGTSDVFTEINNKISELSGYVDQYNSAVLSLQENTAFIDISEQLKSFSVSSQEQLDELIYRTVVATNSSVEYADIIKEVAYNLFPKYSNAASDAGESTEYVSSATEDTANSFKNVSSALDSAQSAYKTLSSAIDEYNKTGVLSIDTLQSLLSLSPEYLNGLFDQSGALNTAQASIYAQANALKIAKIQELQAAAANDVYLYSIGDTSNMSALAQSAIGGIGTAYAGLSATAVQTATKTALSSQTIVDAVNKIRETAGLSKITTSNLTSGMNSIISAYQGIADSIASINVGNISDLSSATSGAGNSASDAADSYEDLVDVVSDMLKQETNDQIDALEDELDLIEEIHDEAVESLEDQISKYEDLVSAKKDALEQEEEDKDYVDELSDKKEDIAEIQAELDSASLDTSEYGIARKKELEEELADAKEDLADYQYEHSIDLQKDELDADQEAYETDLNNKIDALDAEYDATEESYNNKIEALEAYLDQTGTITTDAINLIDGKSESFYTRLFAWNKKYGDMTEEELQNLITNASTAGSSVSSSMNGAAQATKGVATAADTASSSYQKLIDKMKVFDYWYNKTSGDNAAHENSAYWSTNGGYSTHHSGLDSGFVGGSLKGNEEFVKALKGEVYVTSDQQNKYMNDYLPNAYKSAYTSGVNSVSSSTEMKFDNLVSISVSGNVDSSSVSKVTSTIETEFEKLKQTLYSKGTIRTANNFI